MRRALLLSLLAAAVSGNDYHRVFKTTFRSVDGASRSPVTGTIAVFLADTTTVAYVGWASGLDPLRSPSSCTAGASGAYVGGGRVV